MSWLSGFFAHKQQMAGSIATPLDMVMYAAGLVSNQKNIDPLLDDVREITASYKGGTTPFPEKDEETFLHVYLQLEQYLVNKEPLRAFSKNTLRKQFTPELRSRLENMRR